ncbi:ParB/RepB/Spo0J family partition protein [Parabacteroides sp. OttesenSCG-928-K15]|nr:ParB/RepB/Spo0J family partition protein [Parabacteroides sp. OttesenSCG-928-K15]
MTAIKNNGTAVAVAEKVNEVVTAVVVNKPDNGTKKAVNIPMDLIEPSNYNARKTFDSDALKELAQSISVHGLIQPITIRRKGEKGEHYEIICGERRFRACRILNMAEIPSIIRQATDEQAYDLSIIENLQREDVPPMEAAEAYKRLIDTKRYDVANLAIQYGKSEKHIYQMLKLCDLIKGIANLVRVGKVTASAGIVISKYGKKIQEEILKDRLGEDGTGEWCHISASVLEGKIRSYYTDNLDNYQFDKTKCLKCAFNSSNFDLFAEGSGCGKCTNRKCLSDKQTAFLVEQAEAVALADPKLTFVGEQYSHDNEATQIIKKGGYEFKNVQTYDLNSFPTAPTAPQASDYKKTEDYDKAQERYSKEQERYTKQTAHLEELKEQGKIRVYAKIGNSDVKMYYKEVATKDTKTNEQLISDLTAKKKRNNEIRDEKTAEGLKELLRTEQLPQSAFTADEETAMYFFMLTKLRRHNYKAVGLKENDYYGYLTDEKKMKIVKSLTEEQKTIVRRDYLYSHLTDGTRTVGNEIGGMLLAFSRQHLPEKTEEIVNVQKEEYGKKNARLDERIAGLKEAKKKAEAKAKTPKAEQAAEAKKPTETDSKTPKKAKKTDAPTAPKQEAKPKAKGTPKVESTTPKAEPKKEAKTAPQADKVLIVGVPKVQPKAVAV